MAVRDVIVRLLGDDRDLTAKLDDAKIKLDRFRTANPTATLGLNAGNATLILDELKAKLDEFNHIRATARANVDTAEAMLALDRLDLKAIETKALLDRISTSPGGAPGGLRDLARARTMVSDLEQSLGGFGPISHRGPGLFSRLGSLFGISGFGGGGGGGGGGGVASIAAAGGGGASSGLLSSLAGANNQYTGGLIAGLIGLAASVAPAVIPFGVGGAVGLGSFGLASKLGGLGSAKIMTDQQAIQQAQAAIASSGMNPSRRLALADARQQLAHDQSLYGAFVPFGKAQGKFAETSMDTLAGAMTSQPMAHNMQGPGMHATGPSFLQGITGILGQVGGFVKSIGPGLGQMFRASLPFISAFVKIMEQFAKAVMPTLTQMMKQFAPFIPQMVQGFKYITQGIVGFLKALGPGMQAGATVFKAVAVIIKIALIMIGQGATLLAKVFADMGHGISVAMNFINKVIYSSMGTIKGIISAAWAFIKDVFKVGMDLLKVVTGGGMGAIKQLWHDLVSSVKTILSGLASTMGGIGKSIITALWDGIKSVASSVLSWISGFASHVASAMASAIPGGGLIKAGIGFVAHHFFASGGWIHEPIMGVGMRSGQGYTFGESGPELVTPGNRVGAMGGGGNTYQISVNVAPGGSPRDVGNTIVQYIRAYEQGSGTSWRKR